MSSKALNTKKTYVEVGFDQKKLDDEPTKMNPKSFSSHILEDHKRKMNLADYTFTELFWTWVVIQQIFPAVEGNETKHEHDCSTLSFWVLHLFGQLFLVLKKMLYSIPSHLLTSHQRDLEIPFEYPTTHSITDCSLFFGDPETMCHER